MREEIVQRAMRELTEVPPAPLPDAKRIWWLAEIRRRQEAGQRVMRIMDRVWIGTSAAAILGASGIAIWQGSGLPGITLVTALAVICAVGVGLRAVLARE